MKLLLVFVGAGLGGVLRYALGSWIQSRWTPGPSSAVPGLGPDGGETAVVAFPVGTLVINITGCLAIGILAVLLTGDAPARANARLFLLVGLLGGYTTFSAFGRETIDLIMRGSWGAAGMNIALSNLVGIGAAWIGAAAARGMMGAGAGP